MSTDSTPTEASTIDMPKRTIADEYLEAQAAAKKERRNFMFWVMFLAFAILNFGVRVFVTTGTALASRAYDEWDLIWSIFAVLLVPAAVWMYGGELIDYSRSKHRLSLAEAAALKEATKSTPVQ